jgi:hypothetical protein
MTGVTATSNSYHVPTVSPVDWRAVGAYLALACGLAWTLEGIALARGVRFTSLTPGTTALLASVMFTPALASSEQGPRIAPFIGAPGNLGVLYAMEPVFAVRQTFTAARLRLRNSWSTSGVLSAWCISSQRPTRTRNSRVFLE